MLFKIAVLKTFFLNIVKKTPALECPFNKVSGLKVCIFIKKETPTQLFSCEYCEILTKRFFIERITTECKINIFYISCVIALFSLITLLKSVFHGYSVLVSIPKLLTLIKCDFRTHCNVGSSSILIEWLMFRNNPRNTVTSLSNLLLKL